MSPPSHSSAKRTGSTVHKPSGGGSSASILAAMIQSARDALLTLDDDLHIHLANRAALQLFDVSMAGLVDRPFIDFIPEGQKQPFAEWVMELSKDSDSDDEEEIVRRLTLQKQDGFQFPADMTVTSVMAESKAVLVLVIRDVSDEAGLRVEQSLQANQLQTLTSALHVGVLIEDTDRRIVMANRAISELLGWNRLPGELEGQDAVPLMEACAHLFHDEWTFLDGVEHLIKHGEVRHAEELQLKDGRNYLRDSLPLKDDDKPAGHIWIYSDQTQRRTQDSQLIEARKQLNTALQATEKAFRSKSEFLANMSHEIRTPMTAVLGYLDMLNAARFQDDRFDSLTDSIRRNASQLLELINDILDLSKIEANRLDLRMETVQLSSVLDDVVSTMRPGAEAKGLSFSVEASGRLPGTLVTDALRLRQVLLNLASNAVKYTDHGSVTLAVQVERFGEDELMLRVDVRDTGIGIAPDMLDKVFQPFERIQGTHHREGTGLGLSISRRVASLLGGRLTATSEPGEGSEFTFRLPLGKEADIALRKKAGYSPRTNLESIKAQARRLDDVRVLLVEDGQDNQRVIRFYLEQAGAEVDVADNGREAIDKVRSMAEVNGYHLILMDMMMPVMDGYTATKRLRQMGVRLPIIALTAFGMADDRNRTLAAGCNDYVSKPIHSEHFFEVLLRHLPKSVTRVALADRPNDPDEDTQESWQDQPSLSQAEEFERAAELMSSPEQRSHSLLWSNDQGFQELVQEYVLSLDTIIQELRAARLAHDVDTAARIANRIRGSAASYGFDGLHQAASEAETALRDPKAPVQFPDDAVDSLLKTLTSVHQE